jgi:hypothetical protein
MERPAHRLGDRAPPRGKRISYRFSKEKTTNVPRITMTPKVLVQRLLPHFHCVHVKDRARAIAYASSRGRSTLFS